MKRLIFAILFASIAFAQVTPTGQASDNYNIPKSRGGPVLGSDIVGGIMYPRNKQVYGADSSVTDVSPATPLPVWGSAGFNLNAAMGNITGISTVNKFGHNHEIDTGTTADIWDGGAATSGISLIWVAPTAAAVHNIVSTSDVDSVGLGGALTLQVIGLTSWDRAEVSEVVILDGTNDVATDSSYVIIYRMRVLTSGGTSRNAGIITATATAPSATTVTARIAVGDGQTAMAIYGVPSICTFYMTQVHKNVNKAVGAAGLIDIEIHYNPEPDAQLTNFNTLETFGLQTVGTSSSNQPFPQPIKFVGPAIIKLQAVSGTNDMDISAGFSGYLVTN